MNKLSEVFKDKTLIKQSLEVTEKQYRPYDPGWYLYNKLLQVKNIEDKFTDEFIELVYVTLSAWNMNSRGARLSDFEAFKKSIRKHKSTILTLSKFKITDIKNKEEIFSLLKKVFYEIELVYTDKPRLVTFSKAMHFYLPTLVVPIDRKYTLTFFNGNININKKLDLQWKKFIHIYEQMMDFSEDLKIQEVVNNRWSKNIPKIIDNLIIGYIKLKGK
jgi:hypothetical protein